MSVFDDLDDLDRVLAVHEAGHAVVALALGAKVLFVEIDFRKTRDGETRVSIFADNIKRLAICVAGCRVEQVEAPALSTKQYAGPRKAKKGDFRKMRELLLCFPEAQRRAARRAGYQLADTSLNANANAVRKIADELMERRWELPKARIEEDDLMALFQGVQQH